MIAPNATPLMTRMRFLDALRASGLLTADEYARVELDYEPGLRAPELARALVAVGALTQFQVDRLLAGKSDGFALGQYLILDQVGAGTASRVYKARHRAMNRLVAVKVLAADRTRDPARRAAFQADARAAARLAHPNVVTVLDVNQIGERLYLVMEYVEGAAVGEVLRRAGGLPVARACEYARQTALGLQHAHDKELTHGLLTPDAVLVGWSAGRPVVKVAQFERRGRHPTEVVLAASDPANYSAPELLGRAAEPTPAADLYSLGCVLYTLLTARPPFPGGTAEDKARRHLGAEPSAVEELRPGVPPAVAGLVRELMAKNPADRPASAGDVAARLAPFAESDDASGRVELVPRAVPAAGGFLTGFHARPTAPPLSDDTSPWAELAAATLDEAADETPVPYRPKGGSGWLVAVVVSAALVLALAAVALIAAR